jgi:hypothetical protein
MRWLIPAALLVSAWGCGGVPAAVGGGGTAEEEDPGDPHGPPGIEVLPGTGNSPAFRTERTRRGLIAARETLAARMPAPPADCTQARLQSWIDIRVVEWIEARNRAVEATRYAFASPANPTVEERVMAHAVIGLLQEDTALSLRSIPAPAELDGEPDIQRMYAEVIGSHTAPFESSALLEYRECANTAVDGPDEIRNWALFCDRRFRKLCAASPVRCR